MARIEGTAKAVRQRRLPRIPQVDRRSVPIAFVLTPVAVLAPDEWERAIAAAIVLVAAWVVGYFEGRSDEAREVLRGLRRDDRGA